MSAAELFSSDQRDALQEIANVAMGSAGAGLATVLDSFVHLSIPKISLVESKDIGGRLATGAWAGKQISAVRQAFYNRMNGEAIALYGSEGCKELAEIMGHDQQGELKRETEQELLLDMSNILVGACMNGIADQLHTEFGYSAPSILCEGQTPEQLFATHVPIAKEAMLIQIDFKLEARLFTCQLLIFMPHDSLELLQKALNHFLESL